MDRTRKATTAELNAYNEFVSPRSRKYFVSRDPMVLKEIEQFRTDNKFVVTKTGLRVKV